MVTINLAIALAVTLPLLAFVAFRTAVSNRLPFPPGPAPPSIISGNARQLSKSHPWLTYAKWSLLHGPVISFRIFHRRIIVINSAKAARDLLESRSAIYSDRPWSWMFGELVGRKLAVFSISFQDPRFRTYRKLLHTGLNPRVVQEYQYIQQSEIRIFLRNLTATPQNFISHLRRNAGAVILKVSYGYTVSGPDDHIVSTMNEALRLGEAAARPGRWLVDVIPFLRFVPAWMPGANFQRVATRTRIAMRNMEDIPFRWAKEKIETGDFEESFTSRHLLPEDGRNIQPEDEDVIKRCSEALFVGGADTTVSLMTSFFLLMALYPDVQRRAQLEIDTVVGSDRLLAYEDQQSLPYVSALIKEIARLAPVAPLGLPHRVTEDDIYDGHLIPKGCTVVANIWAITHDADLYPDPSTFDPTRHLDIPGKAPQADPFNLVFGYGRRVCPGAHFAQVSLFINISNILAAFSIGKEVDKDGQEIEPEVEYSSGIIAHLKPFQCRITPRKQDVLANILGGI